MIKTFYLDTMALIRQHAEKLNKMSFKDSKERALYIQAHYAKELQHFLYKGTEEKINAMSASKWVDLLRTRGLLK